MEKTDLHITSSVNILMCEFGGGELPQMNNKGNGGGGVNVRRRPH